MKSAKQRVYEVLRGYITMPPEGVVMMANIHDLTDELVERLILDEWFEQWDENDE